MNKVIKNILNDDLIKEINDIIEKELSNRPQIDWDNKNVGGMQNGYRIDPDLGRLLIEHLPLSFNIINEISKNFIDILNGYKYVNTMYCKYSSEYGRPQLQNHLDKGKFETICIDYQLDSNTDWDLTIENKTYTLKNNDAVSFHTKKQLHGRSIKNFNPGEYVTMLFIYFDKIE